MRFEFCDGCTPRIFDFFACASSAFCQICFALGPNLVTHSNRFGLCLADHLSSLFKRFSKFLFELFLLGCSNSASCFCRFDLVQDLCIAIIESLQDFRPDKYPKRNRNHRKHHDCGDERQQVECERISRSDQHQTISSDGFQRNTNQCMQWHANKETRFDHLKLRNPATTAKSATPSTRAAVKIMLMKIRVAISG